MEQKDEICCRLTLTHEQFGFVFAAMRAMLEYQEKKKYKVRDHESVYVLQCVIGQMRRDYEAFKAQPRPLQTGLS